MAKKTILLILILIFPFFVFAQDTEKQKGKVNTAANDYEIGRFENVMDSLETNIEKFSPEAKIEALRLCAITAMAMDDEEKAEYYAVLLLKESPDYNNTGDPYRFRDMIERLKNELTATITTASSSRETLAETPVPVVLITEEMIRDCGAQTLQDALVAYVPGITVMEINGVKNFAMRGISGASQEKVLIMLNGIRLNSYCSNLGLADYSISLKKIKQIEVLRGPASSLYGDAALTAVVNVITKSGMDINGVDFSLQAGNHGQVRADALIGKHYAGFDITAWAGFYRSDGEYVDVPEEKQTGFYTNPGKIIIGGYNNRPSFDFGVKFNYKGLFLEYAYNSSKTVIPFTKEEEVYYRSPYSYSKYCNINGNKPGAAFETQHVRVGYTKKFGKLTLELSGNMTYETMSKYFVISDDTDPYCYLMTYKFDSDYNLLKDKEQSHGIAYYEGWTDRNMGISVQAAYNYGNTDNNGTIMTGADVSVFNYLSDDDDMVYDFTRRDNYCIFNEPIKYGFREKEPKNEFFIQWKHRYKDFIINSGIRSYYRKHAGFYEVNTPDSIFAKSDVKEFSPRISLIYLLDKKLNFKFAYSKAFVDIPFFYRTYDYEGSLKPEKLHSFQFTVNSQKKYDKSTLNLELNFFYNKCKDLAMPNLQTKWDVSIAGIEPMISYNAKKWNLYGYLSFQKVADYKAGKYKATKYDKIYYEGYEEPEIIEEKYDALYDEVKKGSILNVPSFSANFTAGYRLNEKIKICANFYYTGRQNSIIRGEETEIPQVFSLNPGMRYRIKKTIFRLDIHNVFNSDYSLGERSSLGTVKQKGRWFMLGIEAKF